MKNKLWLGAAALLGLLASPTEAGNGSNYIAMLNGVDYFFGMGPYSGPPGLRGIWRCFPSQNLHSPTKVRDLDSPAFNTYATKVCAIHTVVTASIGYKIKFPTITLSTSPGTCQFVSQGNLNFALSAAPPGAGVQLIGPLDGGGIAAIDKWTITSVSFLNPFPAGFMFELSLDTTNAFNPLGTGTISAIPVPDGHSLVLWHAEPNNQGGHGKRFYWTGSLDERNICSGYSFLLAPSLGGLQAQAFSPAFEWATGIGTLDASMTNFVSAANPGNAHGSPALAQPFDAGSGATTVSLTGTTPFPVTSTASEILGFLTYDEAKPYFGSDRLVCVNLWGFTSDGSTACLNGSNPAFVALATGGPGGPSFGGPPPPVGNEPRLVGKLDTLSLALLQNPVWKAATVHGTVQGGANIPWFPTLAGMSGSTGNNGGFAIPIPPQANLVGVRLFAFSAPLNVSGTAIAAFAKEGHSHSNGVAFGIFP